MKYINFDKIEQNSFMKLVKEKSKLKWKEISNFLSVSKSMVYFYLNGHSKISLDKYHKLCNLANVKPVVEDYIEIKNKTEKIKKPKLNRELSELIGILAGDGHLSNFNYEISVSGHLYLDKDYLIKYVSCLFQHLFDVNVKIKKNKNSNGMRCVVNSKLLMKYLTESFEIPVGKKKGNLHIPIQIRNKKLFLKRYLRGLFDTDGSLYLRRKNSLVISIISRDPVFLEEIRLSFIELGYSPSISGKNLYIYDQKEIKKFFNDIGSKNKKHILKYDNFINKLFIY